MDRAFRILTIYNRLLHQKKVNKKSLTVEFNTSPRTIQRDIDDIRNFLYENKPWMNIQNEITYDYVSESYKLEQHETKNSCFMYNILTSLYLTTPKLNLHFYQYLKSMIINNHSDSQHNLLKLLDKLVIDENAPTITQTSLAVQALNENRYLKYHKQLLLPLSISYLMSSFHLVYQLNSEVYIKDINNLDLAITNKSFETTSKDSSNIYVTFEIAKSIFQNVRRFYHVHVIESYGEEHLIVTFKMTKVEAIQLCFLYRSNIRIISPSDVREKVMDELLTLHSTYLKQQIPTT
ncbi:HTH domain-containing protein [Staphylococcus sp. IVB6227]|uniref:helix-turn-helix transcriptional regulator n=1 Tax=Staphylococcus sp. IVB6227 TaxID=2989768 RepID=UPI0021D09043|nr:HTH domain-containing protein [Staphylococcus sp. IVB6227]UXR78437.1 HTH domain-containing protein [Staphylococcus sp. IVB6227]